MQDEQTNPITVHTLALAGIRTQLDEARLLAEPYLKAIADLEAEERAVKQALADAMAEAGAKSTMPIGGIVVTRAQRRTMTVADAQAALAYVRARRDADAYLTVDTKRYALLADSALKATGEILPGAELRTTDYLGVKEAA